MRERPAMGSGRPCAATRLQADALVTIDPALAWKARDIVPLAPLQALTSDLD